MKKLITIMSLVIVGFAFGQDEEPKLNVSGSVDAYFRNNITSANDGAANTLLGIGDYSIFNNDSGFSAGLANVTLSYGGETVGFIADLGYGPRMDTWNGGDVVNEAYMYWNASDKVMLMMGRFNSWMGYERLSAANNFHYSMSHMFSYSARNFNGIVAQFDIGTNLRGGIGVMNPVNQVYGNSGDYSIAAGFTYNGVTGISYTRGGDVSYLDLKTAFDVSDNLDIKLNGHIADFGDDADGFSSISAYAQLKSTDAFSWGMRLEYMKFDNADSLTVLTPTLTGRYSVGDLTIIPEIRLDSASEDIFTDNEPSFNSSGSPIMNSGVLTAFNVAAVYSF
jgi:hypothetical protein